MQREGIKKNHQYSTRLSHLTWVKLKGSEEKGMKKSHNKDIIYCIAIVQDKYGDNKQIAVN